MATIVEHCNQQLKSEIVNISERYSNEREKLIANYYKEIRRADNIYYMESVKRQAEYKRRLNAIT